MNSPEMTDDADAQIHPTTSRLAQRPSGTVPPPFESMMAEVASRAAEFAAELQVEGTFASFLFDQVAVHSIRLERIARYERGTRMRRVATAELARRMAEIDRLCGEIHGDPARVVGRLREIPEGIDRLVAAWEALCSGLTDPEFPRWTADHLMLAESMLGRGKDAVSMTDFRRYTEVYDHHPSPLVLAAELAGRNPVQRQEYARSRIAGFIATEVATLLAERARLDDSLAKRARAEAAVQVRYETSPLALELLKSKQHEQREFDRALKTILLFVELIPVEVLDGTNPKRARSRRLTELRKAVRRLGVEHRERIARMS